MKFELTSYLARQKALDETIARLHDVSYSSTRVKRHLALLVELGELANETRCFKYWSIKGPSSKGVILDEYADGLHFLLSLGVALDLNEVSYDGPGFSPFSDLSEAFINVYKVFLDLYDNYDKDHWIKAMEAYLRLLLTLNYNLDEALEAYLTKLAINYERQKEHY